MALRSGLAAQWCAIDETTYGVAPSLSAAIFYANVSDQLKLKKTPKQGVGIFSGSLAPRGSRRVITEYSAGGPVNMELPERQMNPWLFRMLGSYGQAAATLTQDGSTGAYSATHALGPLEGHSFVVQKGAPTADNGTVKPFTYTGCKVQEWEISAQMGDIVKLAMTIEARNELQGSYKDPLNGSVPTLQAYAAPAAGSVFRWVGGSLLYGGTATTTSGVTSISGATALSNLTGTMTLKCSRPLDLTRYAADVSPYRNEPSQNGLTAITGAFTPEWLSTSAQRAAFQNDTPTAIQLQFTTAGIGSGSDIATFSLMVPYAKLDDDAVDIPGPAVLTEPVTYTGLDDGVNNILQCTYWTLDSV